MADFKVGDKVRHKSTPDFKMVIKEFKVHWVNDRAKTLKGEPNPEYPLCSYYNIHTKRWEEKMFHSSELEMDSDGE